MSESVGEQLRLARQERNLSLMQVAKGTHIRLHYLEAMEAGEFDRLPSRAHARGFLRAYASFLDVDPEAWLISLNGESVAASEPHAPAEPEAPDQPQEIPSEDAAAAFEEIGQQLREQREVLGLSLEDVERHTHLRQHYLLALEAGSLDELPSPVQGRGMLKNYAAFLGLEPDPLLLKFAEGLQARFAARQAAQPRPAKAVRVQREARRFWAPLRRWISSDFLLGGVLVFFLAGFIIWGAIRINTMRSAGAPLPTVPSIAEALMPTPEPTLSPSPSPSPEPTTGGAAEGILPTVAIAVTETEGEEVEPEGTEEPAEAEAEGTSEPASSAGSVQIYITVHQRAWVRVTVDGEVELEGRVLPGSAYSFDGSQVIEILTGNGAALQVFYNQRDLGTLGIYGEVVNRVFTLEGEVLPTPTITPTPTVTPTATASPQDNTTAEPTFRP